MSADPLQTLMDRSVRSATPSVRGSIADPARQMTAPEVREFWEGQRLVAMTTVGPRGQPHLAPVHARLEGAGLVVAVFEDSVRRADLAANPRVAFAAWRTDGAAAILYGRARELPDTLRDARRGRIVDFEVSLTRVYAMRAVEPRV